MAATAVTKRLDFAKRLSYICKRLDVVIC